MLLHDCRAICNCWLIKQAANDPAPALPPPESKESRALLSRLPCGGRRGAGRVQPCAPLQSSLQSFFSGRRRLTGNESESPGDPTRLARALKQKQARHVLLPASPPLRRAAACPAAGVPHHPWVPHRPGCPISLGAPLPLGVPLPWVPHFPLPLLPSSLSRWCKRLWQGWGPAAGRGAEPSRPPPAVPVVLMVPARGFAAGEGTAIPTGWASSFHVVGPVQSPGTAAARRGRWAPCPGRAGAEKPCRCCRAGPAPGPAAAPASGTARTWPCSDGTCSFGGTWGRCCPHRCCLLGCFSHPGAPRAGAAAAFPATQAAPAPRSWHRRFTRNKEVCIASGIWGAGVTHPASEQRFPFSCANPATASPAPKETCWGEAPCEQEAAWACRQRSTKKPGRNPSWG